MPPLQPRGAHLALILPLCTSSATLGLSLFQYPLFLSFLSPKPSSPSNRSAHRISGTPLSHFLASYAGPAAAISTALTLTTAVSGALCARYLRSHETLETSGVSRWYIYGAAAAAVGHAVFLPLVAGPVKRVVDVVNGEEVREKNAEGVNEREMGTWFFWHSVRVAVVDLLVLWCFAEGVALSFWVI